MGNQTSPINERENKQTEKRRKRKKTANTSLVTLSLTEADRPGPRPAIPDNGNSTKYQYDTGRFTDAGINYSPSEAQLETNRLVLRGTRSSTCSGTCSSTCCFARTHLGRRCSAERVQLQCGCTFTEHR
jgi:hypothetical protein